MPYKDLGGNLDYNDSQHGWQVRIAVDPFVLRVNDPNNKIETIKKILNDVLADYPTNFKLWLIPDEQALYDGEYDGTTSRQGKDREQRGKEICIYLADTEHALTTNNYKEMLLALWSKLQKAGIPLMYMNVPGDHKIQGPSCLPTPFSVTSFTQRKEWLDKHGILFKQFVPWDNKHPILKIQLNEKDLKTHNIQFDVIQIAKLNRNYFKSHQDMSLARLQCDIQNIADQKDFYKEVLFDDDIIKHIKSKIKKYNDTIKLLEVDQRGTFQEEFAKEIKEDEILQFICNGYPHTPDSVFSEHVAMGTLRRLSQAQENQVDDLIKQLRDDYEQKVNEIKPDFDKHTNGDDKTPETMHIDWSSYIPGYNDDLCQNLIEKNPAQMQAIYRRIILLERERQAHEQFEKQWLKARDGNNKNERQNATQELAIGDVSSGVGIVGRAIGAVIGLFGVRDNQSIYTEKQKDKKAIEEEINFGYQNTGFKKQ